MEPINCKKSCKILVIEDDRILSFLISTHLKHLGYEVLTLCNLREALSVVDALSVKPKLIITDIILPDLSGIEMIQIFRNKAFNNIPKIVMSSMDGYDVNYFANEIGACAYFLKPFSDDLLFEKIGEILNEEVCTE